MGQFKEEEASLKSFEKMLIKIFVKETDFKKLEVIDESADQAEEREKALREKEQKLKAEIEAKRRAEEAAAIKRAEVIRQ